jgi:hypothetical protein
MAPFGTNSSGMLLQRVASKAAFPAIGISVANHTFRSVGPSCIRHTLSCLTPMHEHRPLPGVPHFSLPYVHCNALVVARFLPRAPYSPFVFAPFAM